MFEATKCHQFRDQLLRVKMSSSTICRQLRGVGASILICLRFLVWVLNLSLRRRHIHWIGNEQLTSVYRSKPPGRKTAFAAS